jgi:acetyltransferase-like isoleucine patch superfamily enzyme
LKTTPLALRDIIYDEGDYWKSHENDDLEVLIDSYAVIDFLPELTKYDAAEGAVILLTNDTTHASEFLQYPDYTPAENVTDTGGGIYSNDDIYHTNAAFYHRFGEFLDELKKNGVYDNTRIIIVSDHATLTKNNITEDGVTIRGTWRERFNPVLLHKDFDAHGLLETDMSFMTNADVPLLTLRGIVHEASDPATGKLLSPLPKNKGLYITPSGAFTPQRNNKNTFKIKNDEWIFVRENIFDFNNWTNTTWQEIIKAEK